MTPPPEPPPRRDTTAAPDAAATRALGHRLRHDSASPATASPSTHVPSRPGSVVWGVIPNERAAVVTVGSGTVLQIDTVSQQGITTDAHPVAFFGALGVPAEEILDDVIAVFEEVERPPWGGHVLTGPVHVEGAGPGDALEVRIHAAQLRVEYGVNRGRPGSGVLADLLEEEWVRLLRTDGERFTLVDGVTVPQAPFPGIVALAPPAAAGEVTSRPPGRWGGNLDLRELTAGSRLFLPVHTAGAQLYLGDPHAAQGDGEVNGTAIEHSCTFTVEVLLHRGAATRWPVAATPTHLIPMGIDEDLDTALEIAVTEAVQLLVGYGRGALGVADAYALCSIGVDFAVTEAVNATKVVHARIPRSLFA